MRRIGLLIVCSLAGTMALAQEQAAPNAVGIYVIVAAGSVTTLDVSFPAPSNMADINRDLQRVTQWTGWTFATPELEETRGKVGEETNAHIRLIEPAPVQSALNDVVWPLVAAFAERRELGIVVQGTETATPALHIENQFVRLEQSGGPGVQLYRVTVKDTGFRNLDELRRNELPERVARPERERPGGALLWVLALAVSLAVGLAVYLLVARRQVRRK